MRHLRLVLGISLVLALAGCGGEEASSEAIPSALKDQVIDGCVNGGQRRLEACECLVEEMEKSWNEEEFDRYIRAVSRAAGDPQAIPQNLRQELRDMNQTCR